MMYNILSGRTWYLVCNVRSSNTCTTNSWADTRHASTWHTWIAYAIEITLSIFLGSGWLLLRLRLRLRLICPLHYSSSVSWVRIWKMIAAWNKQGSTSTIVWELTLLICLTCGVHTTVISVAALTTCIDSGLSSMVSSLLLGRLFKYFLFLFKHFFIKIFIMVVANECLLHIFLV